MVEQGLKVLTIITCAIWSMANGLRPNIVMILTDDQDYVLDGLQPILNTRNLIGQLGATFSNAFTTSPLCCPSRASVLSGMYMHNHHTVNNSLSGGCNDAFWRQNIEPHSLPQILHQNGYETFFGGKYLNQYRGEHVPPGWTVFNGLHGNSRYYNYTLCENGSNRTYSDVYLTDLLTKRLLSFLNDRANSERPFFALLAPPAPHTPFTPAPRHLNHFAGIKAKRTSNFNIISHDKHWLLSSTQLIPNETLHLMDEYFQRRWETLLAVDDMVSSTVQLLDSISKLNNTYIIFTSDNGYHIGQFAQPFDKRQPYETDIRVPLLIRGPGIASRADIDDPVALIDLAPTILKWANIKIPSFMDGRVLFEGAAMSNRALLIQHYGEGNRNTYNAACPWSREDRLYLCLPEADCHCQDAWNNTYACLRYLGTRQNFLYCEFADNENFIEMFDIQNDPYQLQNRINEVCPDERDSFHSILHKLRQCAGTAECSNSDLTFSIKNVDY